MCLKSIRADRKKCCVTAISLATIRGPISWNDLTPTRSSMRHVLSLTVLVLAALTPSPSYGADPWIGKLVFVKEGAQQKVGGTQPINQAPFAAHVGDVDGIWLWLETTWVRKSDVMSSQEALQVFTDRIREKPEDASTWYRRACIHLEKGDFKEAISDFSEAIRLESNSTYYAARGAARSRLGEFEVAYNDFAESLRLNSANSTTYVCRGTARKLNREFDQALQDYAEAVRLDPKCAEAFHEMAWLRATCADDRFRNGKQAIENALRACELTSWKAWNYLGTLSAAYAEGNDYTNAVKWQRRCLELAPLNVKPQAMARLQLYQSGSPYREPPNAGATN